MWTMIMTKKVLFLAKIETEERFCFTSVNVVSDTCRKKISDTKINNIEVRANLAN